MMIAFKDCKGSESYYLRVNLGKLKYYRLERKDSYRDSSKLEESKLTSH